MKISVIGSNGQLGTDLVKAFTLAGHEVVSLTRQEIDVTDIDSVQKALTHAAPGLVVNTAAYVNVNLAETQADEARLVNVAGARNVAQVASDVGARNVYISTDFIFDGNKPFGGYYEPADPAGPLNVYGQTKYEGELAVQEVDSNSLILRISSVFGAAGSSGKGGNFIEAILKKVRAGEVATVIDDNRMTPTYTFEAAKALNLLIESDASGIEHCASLGDCSWFDLASYAAGKVGLAHLVQPVASEPNPAVKRPKNSSLSIAGLGKYGLTNIEWQDSVDAYLSEKKHT